MNNTKNPEFDFYTIVKKSIEKALEPGIPNINEKERYYQYMSGIAYMFGLEFYSQNTLQKQICERTRDRITQFFPNKKSLITYLKDLLNYSDFEDTKENLVEAINQPIDTGKTNHTEKFLYVFRKVSSNCIIPIKFATNINELLGSKNLTYAEVATLNNALMQEFDYSDASIMKTYYTSENVKDLLTKSMEMTDIAKVALIGYDSIISLKERVQDWIDRKMYTIEDIAHYILECETAEFPEIDESESKESEEAPSTEGSAKLNVYEQILSHIDVEYWKMTPQNVIDGLNAAFNENIDFAQYVYNYMKEGLVHDYENGKYYQPVKFSKDEMIAKIDEEVAALTAGYKNNAEKILEEIPKDKLDKLTILINECIINLILVGKNKHYLISQYMNNGISTVQHLIQIVGIIETMYCNGLEGVTAYTKLYNYINDNFKEHFMLVPEINNAYSNISFFKTFREFTAKYA